MAGYCIQQLIDELPKQIPSRIAKEIVITGDFITANRAYELGLINRVVPAGSALDGAGETIP